MDPDDGWADSGDCHKLRDYLETIDHRGEHQYHIEIHPPAWFGCVMFESMRLKAER